MKIILSLFCSMGNPKLKSWSRLKNFSPAGGSQNQTSFQAVVPGGRQSQSHLQCFQPTPKLTHLFSFLSCPLTFVSMNTGMGQEPLICQKHCSCPNRSHNERRLLKLPLISIYHEVGRSSQCCTVREINNYYWYCGQLRHHKTKTLSLSLTFSISILQQDVLPPRMLTVCPWKRFFPSLGTIAWTSVEIMLRSSQSLSPFEMHVKSKVKNLFFFSLLLCPV